jgi:hypothetical protein
MSSSHFLLQFKKSSSRGRRKKREKEKENSQHAPLIPNQFLLLSFGAGEGMK